MDSLTKPTPLGILSAVIIALAGCGGSGHDSVETMTTGFLSLNVSDGPIHNADKVCITFNEIELMSSGNSTLIEINPPEKVNLLEFQGDNAYPILTSQELEAGDYQWMRLGIDAVQGSNGGAGDTGGPGCDGDASYIVMEGGSSVHNLYVPSGALNGLKLVGGFTVPANDTADFTADFDIAKTITAPPGLDPDVVMRPVIRLVNNVAVGTLAGLVATDLATADGCEPSVYVFDNGVAPNPIGIDDDPESTEPDPSDPVATAMVNEQSNNDGSVTWNYTVGFLLARDYEAAFTCDGTTFEPVDGKPAPISVGEITTVDFEGAAE